MQREKSKKFAEIWFVIIVIVCSVWSGNAYATFQEGQCESYKLHLNATDDNFWKRSSSRFGNGLLNAGFGWTQLFFEPSRSIRTEDEDIVTGIFQGAAATTTFMLGGAWDAVFFWLPGEVGKEMAFKDSVFCHMNAS